MCGRYLLGDYTWRAYRSILEIDAPSDPPVVPRYNVCPTEVMPIVTAAPERPQERAARWGLIPHWYRDDPKQFRQSTFNARIETAHEKPTFRDAWRRRRCLVPATGWYEWTGPKGAKQPWYIFLERNVPFFFFAGLWSERADGLLSFTILTRDADPKIRDLHHRMPVILRDDQLEHWLDADPTIEQSSLEPNLGASLAFHKVKGPLRGEGPDLIAPVLRGE